MIGSFKNKIVSNFEADPYLILLGAYLFGNSDVKRSGLVCFSSLLIANTKIINKEIIFTGQDSS